MLGSREDDTILDPFSGSGTTGIAANELNRKAILVELNPSYAEASKERAASIQPQLQPMEIVRRLHMPRKPGSKQRILEFFLQNMGKVLESKDIQQASGGVVEWARRVRELRNEDANPYAQRPHSLKTKSVSTRNR